MTRTPSAIAKARPEPSVWDRFHPGAADARPAAPAAPALAITPDEPITLNNLGEALRRSDRLHATIPSYDRACGRPTNQDSCQRPDGKATHPNLGWLA